VRLLKRHVPARPNLTPLEFEAEVNRSKISPAAKQEFTALTFLLIGARYTPQPPAMSSTELNSCVRRLRRALGVL
jgi:hypothetical protein